MNNWRAFAVALALPAALAAAGPQRAEAAVAAVSSIVNPSVWPNDNNEDWSLGWRFRVFSPVSVTALGYNNYGFNAAHQVGMYTAGGTLLASVSVTGTSTLSDGYRYESVVPLALGPGEYYIVGTTLGLDDGWIFQAANFSTLPGIAYVASYFNGGLGGTLSFPLNIAADREFLNVNFQVAAAIPEPATWAMMLIGFAALGYAARRRRQQAAEA